ncbi:MAG: hypothetical protein K9L60_14560 [Methylovulum sp.]|nr:hypothetical protein [Methylovulum sp.]
MSYFLWVEDFENSPKVTASNVFGSVFDDSLFFEDKRALKKSLKNQGVFIELSFQDGWGVIAADLEKQIDYVILDIDLPAHSGDGINDEILELLETFEDYQKLADEAEDEALLEKKCAELKARAGFYLYTKLVMDLGFPKQNILFCSNHAENNKTILAAFAMAKLASPQIYQKSHPYVQDWVKSRYENPYSRLRRGIIEGCRYLKSLPQDKLRFNKFIKENERQANKDDIDDYLDVLANFLPLLEPENSAPLYKLFIRTLAHEWEAAEPQRLEGKNELFAFSWIMKMTRNWSAHSRIFTQLNASDVAYLFIVNMRTMFDLDDESLAYERHLLSLLAAITPDDMREKSGQNFNSRKLPLVETYATALNKYGNTWQAINFHDALNNLQKSNSKTEDSAFFIKGLYQIFWFLTSVGHVYIPEDQEKIKNFTKLNYQFKYFDYQKSDYLFELARHIYSRSFP